MFFNANLYHDDKGWNCKLTQRGKLAAFATAKTREAAFKAALAEADARFGGAFPPVEETE